MNTQNGLGRYIFIILLGLFLAGPFSARNSFAESREGWPEYDTYGLEYRIIQVTLIPPLGTNGIQSSQYASKYSFNILAGYNGGLNNGYEFGVLNVNRYYTDARIQVGVLNLTGGRHRGFSLAGIGNAASGPLHGLQVGGLFQLSRSHMQGLQFTGGLHAAGGTISGVQVAGIGQYARGDLQGLQFSGLGNVSQKSISGIQVAGLGNWASQSLRGIKAASIANVGGDRSSGIMISGLMNYSGSSGEGIFVSGIINHSTRNSSGIFTSGMANVSEVAEGVFVTGAFNVAHRSMSGIQVAGLLNVAGRGVGVQVAPFNIAKEFSGLPAGLISVYGNGRKQLNVQADETGFISLGVRTGTYEVHNTVSIGYKPCITDRDVFALSWSAGYEKPLSELWGLERLDDYFFLQELSISLVQDDGWFKRNSSQIYSYRRLFGKDLTQGVRVYGGTTFNMLVSRSENMADHHRYHFIETSRGGRSYRFWVGLTAGVQLF
ncbi:hypothetical protein QLX67_08485 [Balneolaceae bacterium ANBcel3]|nr:hypothetical protein [Balneolaceae bacterium ANBcel3]